jgi:predicted amidohydrolase YtcJ
VVAGQALLYEQLGVVVRPALINGAVTTRDDQPFTAGAFAVRHGSIVEMDWLIDAARLREVDLTILD